MGLVLLRYVVYLHAMLLRIPHPIGRSSAVPGTVGDAVGRPVYEVPVPCKICLSAGALSHADTLIILGGIGRPSARLSSGL